MLLRYTYYGDANLDGKVDGSDYTRIDSGFLTHTTGWYNGDFNYDGAINGSDYTLVDNAFNSQGAIQSAQTASILANENSPTPQGSTVVPEPTALYLTLSAAALLGRKRKKPPVRLELTTHALQKHCSTN